MEKIKLIYNGQHDALLRIPGHYAKTKKGAIIEVSKEAYETELKERKTLNGDLEYVPYTEPKQVKKEEQKTE